MYSKKKQTMRYLKITSRITNRDGICLDKYLSEISKNPLLSPEEEVEVAKRARSGEKRAIDLLVVSNLKFVVSVAKQYQNQGLSISDLINEGNIGLMIAAACLS
jgi:RNA polymerase primary sigma factor